jgi:hypothetical protein
MAESIIRGFIVTAELLTDLVDRKKTSMCSYQHKRSWTHGYTLGMYWRAGHFIFRYLGNGSLGN